MSTSMLTRRFEQAPRYSSNARGTGNAAIPVTWLARRATEPHARNVSVRAHARALLAGSDLKIHTELPFVAMRPAIMAHELAKRFNDKLHS